MDNNKKKPTSRGNEIKLLDQQIEDKEVEVINVESNRQFDNNKVK